MKLSAEIKGEIFDYTYDFGEGGNAHGTMTVTPDNLKLFVGILDAFNHSTMSKHETFFRGISAKAWMSEYPDEARQYLKEQASQRLNK